MVRRLARLLAAAAVLACVLAPSGVADAAATPCSAGLVALTFDDGPAGGVTPRLVRMLIDRRVPATFFMVGARVDRDPDDARLVARSHFVVGNHTWTHTALTKLTDAGIRSELSRTRTELRSHGITPSRLMRPPYGATSARVNHVIRSMGLVPVLWTIDTRDWESGSASDIAHRVLSRLKPRATNIVLQHDGVRRSPTSIQAVPEIVREARVRGYCFAALGPDGKPAPPVPLLRVTTTAGREAGRVPVRVSLALDRPTSRRVSVRLTTASGTATSGTDFTAVARTLVFPVGTTRITFSVPVVDDRLHEPTETLQVRLGEADGVRLVSTTRSASIVSDDPEPPPPPAP